MCKRKTSGRDQKVGDIWLQIKEAEVQMDQLMELEPSRFGFQFLFHYFRTGILDHIILSMNFGFYIFKY